MVHRKCFLGRRRFAEVVDNLIVTRSWFAAMWLGCLATAASVLVFPAPAHAQIIPGAGKSLRSLPPIRAIPLQNGPTKTGIVPDALGSPPYCDSAALRETATLRSVRFGDNRVGVAIGDHGAVLVTRDGGATWETCKTKVTCRLNDAHWIDSRRVIVVGGGHDVVTGISRGVILVSNDAGESWERAEDSDMPLLHRVYPIPTDRKSSTQTAQRAATIAIDSEADPITGATQFRSHDSGKSWHAALRSGRDPMDVSRPSETTTARNEADSILGIRASCRLADGTTFRVGDHGLIQRTRDEGGDWETRRGQEASTAMLVIASRPSQIPWSLLGREALEKRLRVNLLVGTLEDSQRRPLEQAAMYLGVAAVDTIDSANELQAWIASRRPKILAFDSKTPATTKTTLIQQAAPLGCGKVIEYERGISGEMLLHDNAVLLGSGALAADFRDDAMVLVPGLDGRNAEGLQPWVAIKTLYGSDAKGDSVASGVHLSRVHRLPPRLTKSSRRRSQVIQGRLKQLSRISDLFEQQRTTREDRSDQFVAAFQLLLDQTSHIDQFRSAWLVARKALGSGYEVPVWKELHERFEHSSAGQLAGLQVKTREKSREWQYLEMIAGDFDASLARNSFNDANVVRANPFATLPDVAKDLLPGEKGHATIVSPFQTASDLETGTSPAVVQASAMMPIDRTAEQRAPASTFGTGNHEVDLAWQMHPVRLLIEDALSKAEEPSIEIDASVDDEQTTSATRERRSADVRRIADGKTDWAALIQTTSPQVAVAKHTDRPPTLDGILDESFWSEAHARPAITRNGRRLKLQVAYDREFLYVAVRTRAEDFRTTSSSGAVGQRDSDLSESDRISLGFDIDQDLLTAMRIGFTRDGRTHDDLDGHLRWNPTWYIATQQHGDEIISEVAIEQSTMGVEIQSGDSWFIQAKSLEARELRPLHWMPNPRTRIRVDFR